MADIPNLEAHGAIWMHQERLKNKNKILCPILNITTNPIKFAKSNCKGKFFFICQLHGTLS